jgi:acyl-coenzyme A synthetase/AMP-(fatty) acid ligase
MLIRWIIVIASRRRRRGNLIVIPPLIDVDAIIKKTRRVWETLRVCKEKMAEYKRPRWIKFAQELPKTATGKIQRFKVREVKEG